MIDKKAIEDFVAARLDGTDYFPVEVTVTPSDEIKVEIDSMSAADIDFCVKLTREIEEAFPRDDEDYELEVGSAGLTSPFKVRRQYDKNIGQDVEVLSRDGKKYKGTLISAGDEGFRIRTQEKVKPEGAKRPVLTDVDRDFAYSDVKSVVCDLKF